MKRLPIVETSVCKLSALSAGRRSTQHRLTTSQKPITCGLERFGNEMNWCHGGRYLFARNRDGSTTSIRSRNLTPCRCADPAYAPRRRCLPLALSCTVPSWDGRPRLARADNGRKCGKNG